MTRRKSVGEEIIQGLEEAVAFERGELTDVPVRRVALTAREAVVDPAPSYDSAMIADVRRRLALSQPVFAKALNVSPETVRAWEQGKREPDGAALRLLQLADEHPQWILESVRGPDNSSATSAYSTLRDGSPRTRAGRRNSQ